METTKKTLSARRLALFFLVILGAGAFWFFADETPQWFPGFLSKQAAQVQPAAPAPRPGSSPERTLPGVGGAPQSAAHSGQATLVPAGNASQPGKAEPLPSAATDNATLPSGALRFPGLSAQDMEGNGTIALANDVAPPLPKAEANATAAMPDTNSTTLEYSTAKPLAGVPGSVGGRAVPLSAAAHRGAAAVGGVEDSLIRAAFIDDFARVLVQNYGPQGTHPVARYKGASTLTLKWANMYYGTNLTGFAVSADKPAYGRARVLQYALMPSMLQELYSLYSKRFLTRVDHEAGLLTRGGDNRHLTAEEKAEMYAIYASLARSLSGALKAYTQASGIEEMLQHLEQAEQVATDAGTRFFEAQQETAKDNRHPLAEAYQHEIIRREQARDAVVSVMRRSGDTRGLDGASLVYIATWLHRRGPEARPAIEALSLVLLNMSALLEQEEIRFQALSARTTN